MEACHTACFGCSLVGSWWWGGLKGNADVAAFLGHGGASDEVSPTPT